MSFIEKLSSKVWTDYNLHDPGITMLELLCYAITDLGYRASYSIPEMMANDPQSSAPAELNFFTAKQILPVNPVSETDIRKIIMDVAGVKNAWLRQAQDYEQPVYVDRKSCTLTLDITQGSSVLPVSGLYNVLVQFEDDNGKKQQYDDILAEVRKRLMQTRNLCEDYLSIMQVQYEDIALCSDIEVRQDADITKVQAKIYKILIDYFSPPVKFHTLQEMLDKGKSIDEIFEGPLLRSGFMDDDELEANDLRTTLHTSDLYNLILDIEEVVAIKMLKLIRYVDGEPTGAEEEWELQLGSFRAARLEKDRSKLMFYKGMLPFMANRARVEEELSQLEMLSDNFRKKGHENDLPIPSGDFREISDYSPVQNDFPEVYGIGPIGLSNDVSPQRKAQALQMKAYLLFYEQLLSGFLAQLANVKKLFSGNHSVDRVTVDQLRMKIQSMTQAQVAQLSWSDFGILGRTYYNQQLGEIRDLQMLFADPSKYNEDLQRISETPEIFSDRRNHLLDHLLARFCEDMTDYSLTLFQMNGGVSQGKLLAGLRQVHDKESLLRDYPKLSSERGKAFNYKPGDEFTADNPDDEGLWDTANIAGLKHRVARLLGMSGDRLNKTALECLRIARTSSYRLTLYDDKGEIVIMQTVAVMREHILAHTAMEDILESGDDAGNYGKFKRDDKFHFRLFSVAHPLEVLAESPPFETEGECDDAIKAARRLFTDDLAVKQFRINNSPTYVVRLYDQDGTTVLAHSVENIKKSRDAEQLKEDVLFNVSDPECFLRVKAGGKYYFRLLNCCSNGKTLMESAAFESSVEMTAAFDKMMAIFIADRGDDVIRRRTIATTMLNIQASGSGSDRRWWVNVDDPDAATDDDYLLRSHPEDTEECAESTLLYILHNGDNPSRYQVLGDSVQHKFFYALFNDCDPAEPIATSPMFGTEKDADRQMRCTIRFFADNCDVESLHVVEHILLRPRVSIDPLLPACVDCKTSSRGAGIVSPKYSFDMYIVKEKEAASAGDELMLDIIKWQTNNAQLKYRQKANTDIWAFVVRDAKGTPVLYSEGYIEINGCTNAIASVRENGLNISIDVPGVLRYGIPEDDVYLGNYRIYPNGKKFSFKLYADNAQVIATTTTRYDTAEAAELAVRDLVGWLAFQENILTDDHEPCGNDEDPYSFRISVLLPAWPTRFRSQYFRAYVEKVIRQETPAHIFPKICWISLQQMRTFEYYYRRWLHSLSGNAIPNPHTVKQFMDTLLTLKNVYPVAVLHSCDDIDAEEPQVILDNTMLGIQ
jgi:uncharacterized protein YegP (UPF0339 family)